MMDVICQNPFHERHEGEPGWCARLGHRESSQSGTDQVSGLFCSACGPFVFAIRDCLPLAQKVATNQVNLTYELSKTVGLAPDEIAFFLANAP